MPEWGWAVIAAFVGLISSGIVATLAMLSWWLWQKAKVEREQARPLYPPEPPPNLDELDAEAKAAALDDVLGAAQSHQDRIKAEWAREKRMEGWSEEDIETFLEERPLLELN